MAWDAEHERLIGPEEILEQDAQRFAEDFGWSLEYAKQRLRASRHADGALSRVVKLPGYGGAEWGEDEGDGLTVWFKDEIPEGALDEVREFTGLHVEARVTEHSMQDLKRYQRKVQRILDGTDGVRSWNAGLG